MPDKIRNKNKKSKALPKKSPSKKVTVRRSPKPGTKKTSARKRAAKSRMVMKSELNPIISPNRENGWEAWQTFNPGAIFLDDKVHFIYRAIGHDGISRFGYASSPDGFLLDRRLSYPVYEHNLISREFTPFSFASGWSFGGAEDPRLTRVDDEDVIYMTYTACDGGLRVGLTSIKISDLLNDKWRWKTPRLISPPGETHKNWVIFPEKINGKYAILHSISPDILITYFDSLDFDGRTFIKSRAPNGETRRNVWDSHVRGAGPPPVKTKYGWLLFYHATDESDPGKYKVGVMLLDEKDPTKVLYRLSQPLLEPDEAYENNGFKSGIVYASGAVVKDGTLLIYYGGSDTYACVAYANLDDFLEAVKNDAKPKLQKRTLIKRD